MFSDKGFGWIVMALVFLEIITIFMLATPETAAGARDLEDHNTVSILGEDRARKANVFATKYFSRHFIETGFVANVRAALIPTEEKKAKATGMEDLLPGLFKSAAVRLEGLWAMIYNSYHRSYVMVFMLMFIVPVLLPTLVDGLVERRISIETNDVAKAVFFHGAKKILIVLLVMPLFILFLPFPVSGTIWFGWLLMLPIFMWVTAKNVQEL